jgi:hypothetical protein
MSFLDNLENNLKALESRDDKDPETLKREQAAREARKDEARRTAPHTDALKNGSFTGELLTACRTIAHARRLLVRPAWVDSTFRLEAGPRKLELRPTPDGVRAVFFEDGVEKQSEPADLGGDAGALARRWLGRE